MFNILQRVNIESKQLILLYRKEEDYFMQIKDLESKLVQERIKLEHKTKDATRLET